MKSSLKKITLAILPLVAFLLIAPSSALAKKKHKHCDRDYYSRYGDDYYRYDRNRDYGRYDDRYYDDSYRRPSRYRPRYDTPYYGDSYRNPYSYPSSTYGNPYGNPYSYPSSTGTFPWWDLLFPRY